MNSHPDFINPIAPAALEVPTFQGGFFFMCPEIPGETAHPIQWLMRNVESNP